MRVEFNIDFTVSLLYCRLIDDVTNKVCPHVSCVFIYPFHVINRHVMRVSIKIIG